MPQMSSFQIMMVLVNSQQQIQPAGYLCACVCVQESEVIPTISRAPNAHMRVSAYVARDREGEKSFSGASVRCWAEGRVEKKKTLTVGISLLSCHVMFANTRPRISTSSFMPVSHVSAELQWLQDSTVNSE